MRYCASRSLTPVIIAGVLAILPWKAAHAVPSFARQTGLECNACHTAYPELNAFGREFKLHGYTEGGADKWYPAVAAMIQSGFTHTAKKQSPAPSDGFNENNNVAVSQASLFYGGKIYGKLGAFSQLTYSGVDNTVSIDNTDIRYADQATIAGQEAEYGITLNNNPTVEDPWNTLPAWGYPFASSDFLPGPAASVLLDGGLGTQVGGLGGYVHWNDMVYLQVAGYRTLSTYTQRSLGVNPAGEDQVDGVAPYWRLAVEHSFGDHYINVGTFGLAASTFPGRNHSKGTDDRVDVGLDAQYQYNADAHDVGVYFRWIHESADYNASQPLGNASNSSDSLDDIKLTASYLYDKTYGADLGFHSITGGADATKYGTQTGSPDTESLTFQADWLPFNKDGGPSTWKWFNPKFVLQYTKYFQFDGRTDNIDGNGRNAGDNDTFYALMWAPL